MNKLQQQIIELHKQSKKTHKTMESRNYQTPAMEANLETLNNQIRELRRQLIVKLYP